MACIRHQFQVLWSVVRLDSIAVMYVFPGIEVSPQHLLHDQPMLLNIAILSRRMFREVDEAVSSPIDVTALVPWMLFPDFPALQRCRLGFAPAFPSATLLSLLAQESPTAHIADHPVHLACKVARGPVFGI